MRIPIINLHFPLKSWEGKNPLPNMLNVRNMTAKIGPSSLENTTNSHFSEAPFLLESAPPKNPPIFASPKKISQKREQTHHRNQRRRRIRWSRRRVAHWAITTPASGIPMAWTAWSAATAWTFRKLGAIRLSIKISPRWCGKWRETGGQVSMKSLYFLLRELSVVESAEMICLPFGCLFWRRFLFWSYFFCWVVLRVDGRSHHNLLETKMKTMYDWTLPKVLACLCEVLLMTKSC